MDTENNNSIPSSMELSKMKSLVGNYEATKQRIAKLQKQLQEAEDQERELRDQAIQAKAIRAWASIAKAVEKAEKAKAKAKAETEKAEDTEAKFDDAKAETGKGEAVKAKAKAVSEATMKAGKMTKGIFVFTKMSVQSDIAARKAKKAEAKAEPEA